jgi:hypothetical protein
VLLRVPVLGGEPRVVVDDVESPAAVSADGRQLAFLRRREKSVGVFVAGADGC